MAIYYSIIGFILQSLIVNALFALTPVKAQDLKDVRIKIELSGLTLKETFEAIEKNTEFRFVYIDKEIPLNQKIKLSEDENSLLDILTGIARECNLSFKRTDNQIMVKKEIKNIIKKKIILKGIVFDSNTKLPIEFANIVNKNNKSGSSTDEKGEFTIPLDEGDNELLVSYIGYKTEVFELTGGDNDLYMQIPLTKTDVLLQEVSVYSKSIDTVSGVAISSVSLQSKKVEQISGVFPDVFRSIQFLPGIAVNNEYSAKFNVRGGNYDENLVVVNGTQVYEPFHLKEAQNASIGIFNINLMNNVEMITGGFSAMYGDRLSSVLNIEYREGSREKFKSSATLSLTNLDASFEGPLTSNGSFLIGVRKSYLEYALSMLGAEDYARPAFYDVQGIMTYSFSPASKLQLKVIHSGDDFTSNEGLKSYPYSGTGTYRNHYATYSQLTNSYNENDGRYFNTLFDLQHTLILSGKAILKSYLSYYEQSDDVHHMDSTYYRIDINSNYQYFYGSRYRYDYDQDLRIKTLEGKLSLDYQVTPFYEIRTGLAYQNLNYNQILNDVWRQTINQNTDNYPVQGIRNYSNKPDSYVGENITLSAFKYAGYVENVFQIDKNILLNAGGRIDYFNLNKDLTFSPRLSLSYKTPFGTMLRAAWGFYFQSPIYNQLKSAAISDTNTQSQKATHYIFGLEHIFQLSENSNQSLTIKLEGFYKKYDQLISTTVDSYSRITYSRQNDSEGFAKGIDVYAILNVPGFYSWLCYEYLYSRENFIQDPSKEFPRFTDQRHTLSYVADFDLGLQWGLNLRATYGSGFAFTRFYPEMNPTNLSWKWVSGEKNGARIPEYKRVDLRVSKSFELWNMKADLFFDVSNLFNFENIMGYNYRFDDNGYPKVEVVKLWPIIPSIGFTIHF